ncbi:MAG: hypothetical protein NVV62_12865 [Terricaulis sp.]|nr:hypothetical protein [Terricaulis sp.]
MADGALTISLDGPLAEEIRAAAKARGQTPEDYVRTALAEGLAPADDDDDLSWEEDMRRLEEPGENIPLDEAFDRFEANIAELRAQKNR